MLHNETRNLLVEAYEKTHDARCDDWPVDQDLSFRDVDDLLGHWIIEGRPFKDILLEIEL